MSKGAENNKKTIGNRIQNHKSCVEKRDSHKTLTQ